MFACAYLAHHFDRNSKLWVIFETGKDPSAEWWMLAHQHLNLVWLRSLQTFDIVDPSIRQPSHCCRSNVRYLLHLVRTVVPDSGSKAACKLQSMPNGNRILEIYLAVDNTADEAVDVVEHHLFVLLELSRELCILFIRRKVNTSKLGLDDQTALVLRQRYVDFDRILYTARTIEVLE